MLALIDGLRTKLTALSDVVQGLVNKPASTVPYSRVGDIYLGNETPPNPEPGYYYRCESLTSGLKFSGYGISTEDLNRLRPWQARKSWTQACTKYGWAQPSKRAIDDLQIHTLGRRGSVIVNHTTKRLFTSEDGHVNWLPLDFPDQDNCYSIRNFSGLCYSNMGYMLAQFKNGEGYLTKLLKVVFDQDTGLPTWSLVIILETMNPAPSGKMGEIIDFDVDKGGECWAILYKPDSVAADKCLLIGRYGQEDQTRNFNLGAVENYTTATIGYSGSYVLLSKDTGIDIYEHVENAITLSYPYSAMTADLMPAPISANNRPVYTYDNGSGWLYINAAKDKICYISARPEKNEIWLTFSDWLSQANLDPDFNNISAEVLAPESFNSVIYNQANNLYLISVKLPSFHIVYFSKSSNSNGDTMWIVLNRPGIAIKGNPAINNDNTEVYFLEYTRSYEYKVDILFSQCLLYYKDISMGPLPGGWCITGKDKMPEEVSH